MDVLKGFRTIDKVFTMGADENITASMLCQVSVDGSDVTLVKGFDGTGVPFFALNNYDDTDAQSLTGTIMGDGSGSGSRITAIPATGAVELVITQYKGADTDDYSVGDFVVPSYTITSYDLDYDADGKIAPAPAVATFDPDGTVGAIPVVGVITEVRTDAVVIYPMDGTSTIVGTYSA
jgi:hypothetical protein